MKSSAIMKAATDATAGTKTPKSVLLLGRANDNEEAADVAYILLHLTAEGLENIKKLGAKVDDFAEIVGNFSSTELYAPEGVNIYLVKDTEDEPLEIIVGGVKGQKAVFPLCDGEVTLEILDRVSEERALVRLTPVDEDLLQSMHDENEPNFAIDSHLLRFYAGDAFYLYCMFKYAEGGYALDSILLEQLESYFQTEPAAAEIVTA